MFYDGLLERQSVGREALDAVEGQVERSLKLSAGCVEIKRHRPKRPLDDVFVVEPDVYLLNLALSRRPAPTMIAHLGARGRAAPRRVGRVVLTPPGSTMRVMTPAVESRSLHCALSVEFIKSLLPSEDTSEATQFEAQQVDCAELEWLQTKIARELGRNAFGGSLVIEAMIGAVAVELIRRLDLCTAEPSGIHKGGLAPWRLQRVRERVHSPAPPPSLTELAELCDMTVRQLARGFKVETGQTLGDFVQQVMLERARALLTESNLPIAEISRQLGFAQPASFTYAFRRATGVNPSGMRHR